MLLSCGDALIDFLPVTSVDGRDAIVPAVGGSCLNVAVGMARLGAPAGFVGGISTDLFGRMIADHAAASQVDLRYATRSEHQPTPPFVRTVEQMDAVAAFADIVRMSDVDFEFLYGRSDYAERARSLIETGAGLVVITRGNRGAVAWHKQAGMVEVAAPAVDVVDTVGAGDSFQAALLFALRATGRIGTKSLACMDDDGLRRVLSFAAGCAAFTCGRPGADPPRQDEIGDIMRHAFE